MGAKDIVYLGLIALSAVIFYLHGLYTARSQGRRKLDVPFNDSGCLTELPQEPIEKVSTERLTSVPSLTQEQIRQTFGNN